MKYLTCKVQKKTIELCKRCYQHARSTGTIRMRPRPQHPQIVPPPEIPLTPPPARGTKAACQTYRNGFLPSTSRFPRWPARAALSIRADTPGAVGFW